MAAPSHTETLRLEISHDHNRDHGGHDAIGHGFARIYLFGLDGFPSSGAYLLVVFTGFAPVALAELLVTPPS